MAARPTAGEDRARRGREVGRGVPPIRMGRTAIPPKTTFRTVISYLIPVTSHIRIGDFPRIHIPNRAQNFNFPKSPLALGGGMWHTVFVLPLKGEITDFPRSGRARRPAEPQGGFDETVANRRVWGGTSRCVILWLIPDLLQLADELFLRRSDAVGSRGQ